MSYFNNVLTTSREEAAVIPESDYTWYAYNADRGTKYTTTSGKRSVTLRSGDKFGIRPATNGKTNRMISKELGPTIVFTLSEDQVTKLQAKAKKAAAGKPTATKSDSSSADDVKRFKAAVKAIVDLAVPSETYIKVLTSASKILSRYERVAKNPKNTIEKLETLQKGMNLVKHKTPFKAVKGGDEKAMLAAIKQGNSYLKMALKDPIPVRFSDAADLYQLAFYFAKGYGNQIKRMSFDTNIREDMSKYLYDSYDKVQREVKLSRNK